MSDANITGCWIPEAESKATVVGQKHRLGVSTVEGKGTEGIHMCERPY